MENSRACTQSSFFSSSWIQNRCHRLYMSHCFQNNQIVQIKPRIQRKGISGLAIQSFFVFLTPMLFMNHPLTDFFKPYQSSSKTKQKNVKLECWKIRSSKIPKQKYIQIYNSQRSYFMPNYIKLGNLYIVSIFLFSYGSSHKYLLNHKPKFCSLHSIWVCRAASLYIVIITNNLLTGLPQGLSGKESSCNAGDAGSIPGWRRSPRGGHDNPLQFSCWENSMDRRVWRAMVYGVSKSQTLLK